MIYTVDHIPISKGKRPGTTLVPTSITVHNTANTSSTAKNERGWLTNTENIRNASFHIVVDENEAIECIPLTEVAYHAGKAVGNRTSLGIELCESGNQEVVWDNAVKLIAKMLYERGWAVDKVCTHKSWSSKNCPRLILPRWDQFTADIQKELLKLSVVKEPEKVLDEVSNWAKLAQSWVKENGVSDGTKPKDSVTREQVWQMLYDYDRKVKK